MNVKNAGRIDCPSPKGKQTNDLARPFCSLTIFVPYPCPRYQATINQTEKKQRKGKKRVIMQGPFILCSAPRRALRRAVGSRVFKVKDDEAGRVVWHGAVSRIRVLSGPWKDERRDVEAMIRRTQLARAARGPSIVQTKRVVAVTFRLRKRGWVARQQDDVLIL